jgi:hypothetical protein
MSGPIGNRLKHMPDKGWHRRFDKPIVLPGGGGKLFTLKHAIAWLANEVPQSEHTMKEVQTAARCVNEAAENNGPMVLARIGMMEAINRHRNQSRRMRACPPLARRAPNPLG